MLLIGESINATIPSVNQAIINKDKAFIAKLTQEQCAAGAHYIDVNAGTGKGDETKDLLWLTAIVQGASDKPLCLDSSDPKALEAAVSLCQMPPILNSICAEPKKLSTLLPIIEKNPCRVIALAHGEGGIPDSVEERMRFASIVIKELRHAGLNDDAIFLDPVLMGLS
ncbi:MAG: dihydropteroate synthase, partial [Eubacterium sp.]